jgi:hypothetical protein
MAAVAAAVVSVTAAIAWSCSSQNPWEVSKALADKLTDSMDFSGGSKVAGAPPKENAGGTAFPQVASVTYGGPAALKAGDTFTLTPKTDFANKSLITGSVLYVWNKDGVFDNYIRVSGTPAADGTMTLSATLKSNDFVSGGTQSFKLLIAMGIGADSLQVGNYREIEVKVLPPSGAVDAGSDSAEVCNEPVNFPACKNVYFCRKADWSSCYVKKGATVIPCAGCDQASGNLDCGDALNQMLANCPAG